MKFNPLLNELSRGIWAMSFEGLQFWGPIAQRLINGENFTVSDAKEINSCVSYISSNGNPIQATDNGALPEGTIAIVDMIGPIIKYGDYCSYGADEIVSILKANDANPKIVAQILNIDGPGGAVSAIAPFVEFGLTKSKPVIGLLDMCCSAHLYAAVSCCDHLMAANNISATIGSIGVVLSFVDNKNYLEKMGYTFHEIYPDESANKNESFRLAMEGNYEMIKEEMLSPMAKKFQNDVKAARPNLKAEPGVLTGKTFGAEKALEVGLIDSIGSMKIAIDLATMLGEMNHYKNY
jgi:protease-4